MGVVRESLAKISSKRSGRLNRSRSRQSECAAGGRYGALETALGRPISARRGIVLIEIAVIMPLLLMLLLGCMEYGWMFLKSQQITNAARQGARTGAIADATVAEIQTVVANVMFASGLDGSGYVVTITPGDPTALEMGQLFEVAVSVSYDNIGFGVPLVPTPATLEATVTMAREGP